VVSNDATAAAKCEEVLENATECHSGYPTGCSPTGKYDGYLNYLKNQHPALNSTPVKFLTSPADYKDLDSRTPKELAKTNHLDLKDDLTKMGEGQEYGVIGYLYYAKQEGAESSNCELTAPDDTDYHIGIGFDKSMAAAAATGKPAAADKTTIKETAVVVEMTPQYRANCAPEWTIDALKKVIGKQVKVVGQLMADNEHNEPKDNCAFPDHGDACWRASIWELHPVTSFKYCNLATECTQDGPGWVDLGGDTSPAPAAGAPPSSPAPAPTKKL
jgi:hypothetical protein